MKNILVPLGLSDAQVSLSRLAYAIQLAKETGGKVYVAKKFKELPRTGSLPSANNALKDITIAEIEKEIAKIDTDGVEPLIYLSEEVNVLREDEIKAVVSQVEALKNAPEKDSDYFKVPTILKK